MSSASNFIGDSVNRASRLPTWTKWVPMTRNISKWEASILNTAARRAKKVELCQRKCWKGSGLKSYLWLTVNWTLHITCLCKKQLHSGPLGVNTGIVADFVKCRMVIHFLWGFNKTLTPGQLTPYWPTYWPPYWPPLKSMGKWKLRKKNYQWSRFKFSNKNLAYLKLSRWRTRWRFPTPFVFFWLFGDGFCWQTIEHRISLDIIK